MIPATFPIFTAGAEIKSSIQMMLIKDFAVGLRPTTMFTEII